MLKQDAMFKDQEVSDIRKENLSLKEALEKLMDPKGKKKKK
jgi:hypothetical protein